MLGMARPISSPEEKTADPSAATAGPGSENSGANPAAKGSRRLSSKELRLWHKIENEQRRYGTSFQHYEGGGAQAFWRNDTICRFWMDQLSSSDPERVELAIEVLEGAAIFDPMDGTVSKVLRLNTMRISQTLKHALDHTIMIRGAINHALSQTEDEEEVAKIEGTAFARVDANDGKALRDAQPIIEVFVPRLTSTDSTTSETASKVLNMFTYQLFPEESFEWWQSILTALRNSKELGEIID